MNRYYLQVLHPSEIKRYEVLATRVSGVDESNYVFYDDHGRLTASFPMQVTVICSVQYAADPELELNQGEQ